MVRGSARRRDDQEITLLKTVGLASEDLVIAHAAIELMGCEPGVPAKPSTDWRNP